MADDASGIRQQAAAWRGRNGKRAKAVNAASSR
jgi:hypothetical protein